MDEDSMETPGDHSVCLVVCRRHVTFDNAVIYVHVRKGWGQERTQKKKSSYRHVYDLVAS